DVEQHMADAEQQRLDGYSLTAEHAHRRKAAFDKRVVSAAPGEVTFRRYDLVQIHKTALGLTHSTNRKLLPQWSTPVRV
ncbi:hypothetical protein BV25DRAFT_1774866, partial [Artomyces pyxidatus]